MTTMKFCSMNGPTESEVESLLMSPCWGPTQNSTTDQYLLDGHKLLLDHDLDSLPSDNEQKNSLDVLDNLLMNSSSLNALSDLKPLPPFTGYTGHLSINGISGHHYHAIAQRLPDESNNNYMQSAYHTTTTAVTNGGGGGGNNNNNNSNLTTSIQLAVAASSGSSPLPSMQSVQSSSHTSGGGSSHGSSADHNIVSSSTCLPESMLSADADACLNDVKLFADSQLDTKLSFVADSCLMPSTGMNTTSSGNTVNTMLGGGGNGHSVMHQSDQNGNAMQTTSVRIYTDAKDLTEYVDMNSIDDIAAIIGSAIADTTVANQLDKDDGNDTRDSWMDLDAWIDGNCIQHTSDGKLLVQQDTLSDFILPHSPVHHTNTSTLQSLLTHGYMPLLQNRLQNGPPNGISLNGGGSIKSEAASSTSYCTDMVAATSTSSPPGSVVSTTENLMINPRYLSNNQTTYQITMGSSMKADGLCSPDLMGNYPHTTTVTTNCAPKAKRSRSQKKNSQQQQQQQLQQQMQQQQQNGGISNTASTTTSTTTTQLNAISPSSMSFSANDLQGLLGKEKPVHRCSICNRGFLNKSNIKVHLRTHTGEKPFRCDVCAKAFRQKAHLLKHQQIHKRIGRD